MAIRSVRHRGLRRLWEHDDARGVPPDSAAKLRRMLAAIHRTRSPERLAAAVLPGWRVHRLLGDLAGFWSLTVTGNGRLIVRFEDGDALSSILWTFTEEGG